MRVVDDAGRPLNARFSAYSNPLSIVIDSAGGRTSSVTSRNRDYAPALLVLLKRLAALDATLTDAAIETGATRSLSLAERRLPIRRHTLPLKLATVVDHDVLRRDLTDAQGRVGRSPTAKPGGGNNRKRMRLYVDITTTGADAATLEYALAFPESAGSAGYELVEPGVWRAAPTTDESRVGRGQGRINDARRRRAVEIAAMRRAEAELTRAGWKCKDVSTSGRYHPYDLLCVDKLGHELHAEVKGTVGDGETVLLTAGEVAHATGHPDESLLIVVRRIVLERAEDDWIGKGGDVDVYWPWRPDPAELTPMAFSHELGSRAASRTLPVAPGSSGS
jgi:hypothetical protein